MTIAKHLIGLKLKRNFSLIFCAVFICFASLPGWSVNKPPESVRDKLAKAPLIYASDIPPYSLETNMGVNKSKVIEQIPSNFEINEQNDYLEIFGDESIIAENRAYYFFEKNKVSGYFLMEWMTLVDEKNAHLDSVRGLALDDNYVQSDLTIPATMAVKFYKQINGDFIERYAIINDKVLAFEAFFPARYDQMLKPKVANYINELLHLLDPTTHY